MEHHAWNLKAKSFDIPIKVFINNCLELLCAVARAIKLGFYGILFATSFRPNYRTSSCHQERPSCHCQELCCCQKPSRHGQDQNAIEQM